MFQQELSKQKDLLASLHYIHYHEAAMNTRFLIFIGTFLSIIFLATSVVTSFVSLAFSWPLSTALLATITFFALVVSYIIGDQLANRTDQFYMKWLGGIFMGGLSVSFTVSLLGHALLAWTEIPKYLLGLGGLGLMVFLTLLGLLFNYVRPAVITKRLAIAKLSTPLRIVQVTDLHFNGLKRLKWAKDIVETVNALNPDIVVFTGDFADVAYRHIQKQVAVLAGIQAKIGKFAVSGNHDFYNGYSLYQDMLKEIGFTFIDNQVVSAGPVQILGLPDKDGESRDKVFRRPISELVKSASTQDPIIVLDHRPEHILENVAEPIAL